ncbi:response regulator [Rhizobium wenxiniae]|uniref:response regulator n=1 Tax=Rhizobium wenxiniae TaxID=1737357 RepID=UPI003C291956
MTILPKSNLLDGLSVLIVEDEYFVATDLARVLEDAGATVEELISNVQDAANAMRAPRRFDVVILDVNLRGEMIYDLADRLLKSCMPFIFVTGYQCDSMPERFRGIPCLGKPCDDSEIVQAISSVCSRRTRTNSAPFGE